MSCRLDLVRVEESSSGVFGVLLAECKVFCLTLEPPDLGNKPDVSCIPPGRYACRRVNSPRFGETFEVAGVPGRSHILFHVGNLASDTKGCILTGRRYGWVSTSSDSGRGLLDSRAAFQDLMDRLHGEEECHLVVHSWKQALLHHHPWESAHCSDETAPDTVVPDRQAPDRRNIHQPGPAKADPATLYPTRADPANPDPATRDRHTDHQHNHNQAATDQAATDQAAPDQADPDRADTDA